MKSKIFKTVISFICVLAILCPCASFATSTGSVPVTVTLTISEDIEIPDDGLNLIVYCYFGRQKSVSVSGSSGGHLGYQPGTYTDTPTATKVPTTGNTTMLEYTSITIPQGQSTVTCQLDIPFATIEEYVPKNRLYRYLYIGYVFSDEESYVGSDERITTDRDFLLYYISEYNACIDAGEPFPYDAYNFSARLSVSGYRKTYISGSITVPEHNEDLTYTVVAEGNRTLDYNENGSYNASRSFAALSENTIAAGETTSSYKMLVKPGMTYDIYVVFSNGEYIRQYKTAENVTQDTTVAFDGFEKSSVVKGTIKLPADMTEFKGIDETILSEVSGEITLQSNTAPYYYLDTLEFTIDAATRSAEFELVNDMGADSAVVYYSLYEDIIDVYNGGHYKNDNEESVMFAADAAKLDLATDNNIIVNIGKGTTVAVTEKNTSHWSDIVAVATLPCGKDAKTIDFYGSRDENEVGNADNTYTHYFTFPSVCAEYNIAVTFWGNSEKIYRYYDGIGEFVSSRYKTYLVSDGDAEIEICPKGSDSLALALVGNITYLPEDSEEYCFEYLLKNRDNEDKSISTGFISCYDDKYNLIYVTASISVNVNALALQWKYNYIPKSIYDAASNIKLIIMDENLKPLSKTIMLK